jgi:hypothetical protein
MTKKRFLEVRHFTVNKNPEIKLIPIIYKEGGFDWGITNIGCRFESTDGSCFFIHPKSVVTLRQFDVEEHA